MENILSKVLEQNTELRNQTAGELSTDLKRLKRDLESGQSNASAVRAGAHEEERVTDARRGWRTWAIVAGCAVIAVTAITAYFSVRPAAPPRVLRTVQLTNTNRPKSGVVTDGSRLYFVDGQAGLSQVSVAGGETVPVPTSLEGTRFSNNFYISPDGASPLITTAPWDTVRRARWN